MKKLLLLSIFSLLWLSSNAQVKDLTFTISPSASYHWWNDKSGLEDNYLYGGRLGFGLGEFVELRALYYQSNNLKTSFIDYGLPNYVDDQFVKRDVDLSRWGGEIRASLGGAKLKPYLTLGTGVQTIKADDTSYKQIFASGGAGIKFYIGNRTTLSLEATHTLYNFKSLNLLDPQNITDYEVDLTQHDSDPMNYWSVLASLDIYLGGRTPNKLTELDKAYLNMFKSGFRGIRWVLEPGVGYLKFEDNQAFRNTYLIGGYAGIDFNDFVGIRGFFFKATTDDKLSFDFDNLQMYGGEFRTKLNLSKGVTPYLAIGGGYINPMDNYMPSDTIAAEGQFFAHGGLGLNIPLSKNLELFGSAKYLLTSNADPENLENPETIKNNFLYSGGLRFTLGRKAVNPQDIYNANINTIRAEEEAIREQERLAHAKELTDLKQKYEQKLDTLNQELQQAYAAKDMDKAIEILQEKEETEEVVETIENAQLEVSVEKPLKKVVEPASVKQEIKVIKQDEEMLRMTPEEFEQLIKSILQNVNTTDQYQPDQGRYHAPTNQNLYLNDLEQRVQRLEFMLLELQRSMPKNQILDKPLELDDSSNDQDTRNQYSDTVFKTLVELKAQVKALNEKVDKTQKSVMLKNELNNELMKDRSLKKKDRNRDVELEYVIESDQPFFSGIAPIAGFSLGDETAMALGLRAYIPVLRGAFELMPEFFYSYGNNDNYGGSLNLVKTIKLKKSNYTPYFGIGVAYDDIANESGVDYNVILGTELPVLDNNLFVDLSIKSFENYHFSVGYRFDI